MATAFYPQIDICRIDSSGYRVAVVSTTIDVYDVTGAGSLGTIASDANGVVVQGSKTGTQAGNVIELSVAGEPLTQRFVLQATQAEAYTAVGNNFASYIVENLFTSTTNSGVVHLYAEDLDNPLTEPIYLGQGLAGTTAEVPYQTNLIKNLRIKAISIDDNQNRSSANLQAVTNYQDITIPGNAAALLFTHIADRRTPDTADFVAYSDSIPANTLANNGDVIKATYAGIFDASNTLSTFTITFGGTQIFFSDDFGSLILDGTHWEFNISIIRVNNTIARCVVSFLSPGEDAFIQYTERTGLALATTAYDIEFKTQTDTAGDVTAKMAHAVKIAAPPIVEIAEITGLWAAYEADSFAQGDGTNITTSWTDATGNGRHATVTNTPTYETAELNNEAIVRLGADSNDYFTLPSMAAFTAGAIVQVKKVTSITTSGGNEFGNTTEDHYPFTADGLIYSDFGTTARKNSLTSLITILNTWHVLYAWSASADWGLQQNWVSVHTTATNTVGFPAAPKIGTNTSGPHYMKEDLAATYIFNVKPTAAALALLKQRIERKYGL